MSLVGWFYGTFLVGGISWVVGFSGFFLWVGFIIR